MNSKKLTVETIRKNLDELIEYLERHPWIVEAYNDEADIETLNSMILEEFQFIMLLRKFMKRVSDGKRVK